MGLDLILACLVLIAAVRGWLQGFVTQAIRLGGLVACVYEAAPVRDLARPHLEGYLKGIRPELFDRMLWWAACVVSYVVTVGLASLLVRAYRRRPYGEPDLYRGDQAAGLVLGGLKGVAVALLLTAALDRYALGTLKSLGWAEQQVMESHALVWTQRYHPVTRAWNWPPVQTFVAHVQKMGVKPPEASQAPATATAARTGESPRPLEIDRGQLPPAADQISGIDAAIEAIERQLPPEAPKPN
jgi:uncharacterized membrane protein required for colicin V production